MLDYFELNPVKLNTLWGKKSSRGFKDIKMNPGSLKKYLLYHAVEAFARFRVGRRSKILLRTRI